MLWSVKKETFLNNAKFNFHDTFFFKTLCILCQTLATNNYWHVGNLRIEMRENVTIANSEISGIDL